MKRDFRRGLVWHWRLLEVAATNPARLPLVWRKWFGVTPVFDGDGAALSFCHFRLDEGTRLIVPLRPQMPAVSGSVIAMATSLVAAKYSCSARLANADELLRFPDLRAPALEDEETVEEFPVGRASGPVVAEYAHWAGWYIRDDDSGEVTGTTDPEEALDFTPALAREWLTAARLGRRPEIVLRYRAGAIAEAEQRFTGSIYDSW